MKQFLRTLIRSKPCVNEIYSLTGSARNLDYPALIGFASILSLPLGLFYVTSLYLTILKGSVCLLSFSIAAFVLLISAYHFKELLQITTKNSIIYDSIYSVYGEFLAYLSSWTYAYDSIIYYVIIAKLWSYYLNVFSRQQLKPVFSLDFQNVLNFSFLEDTYDCLPLIAVIISALTSLCEYQVFGTLTISVTLIMLFTVISTSVVGYLSYNADHWNLIESNLNLEVLSNSSYFYCLFFGIETFSLLYNGTPECRKRIGNISICSCLVFLGTVAAVLIVYFCVVDSHTLRIELSLPVVYHIAQKPAARYFATVGAVCGLTGATVVSAMPLYLVLTTLGNDGLLPLQTYTTTTKAKIFTALLVLVTGASLLILKTSLLFSLIRLNTNARLLILAYVVLGSRMLKKSTSEDQTTIEYKKLITPTLYSKCFSDDSLTDTINEDGELQDKISLTAYDQNSICQIQNSHNKQKARSAHGNTTENDEIIENLDSTSDNKENNILNTPYQKRYYCHRKSGVCGYGAVAQNNDEMFTDFASMKDAFELRNTFSNSTLFPPLLSQYKYTYRGNSRSFLSGIKHVNLKPSTQLILFLANNFMIGLVITKLRYFRQGYYLTILILLFITLLTLAIAIYYQTRDQAEQRRPQVPPLTPFTTFLIIFLLTLTTYTITQVTIIAWTGWMLIGTMIYLSYGNGHSRAAKKEGITDLYKTTPMTSNLIGSKTSFD